MAVSTKTTSSLDSQEALAASIAREVQLGLPGEDSSEAITESVGRALLEEASANERSLAYMRVAFLAGLVVGGGVAYLWPALVGLSHFPGLNLAVALLWLLVAGALLLALAKDWYRPWLRRAVPVLDALIIGTTFLALEVSVGPVRERLPAGFIGAAATACAFLAGSSAVRLSRSAAKLSTALALLTWVIIVLVARLGVFPAIIIAALILGTGILGTRVTRVIRRVITNQVAHLRLARMYESARAAIDAREEVLRIVSHDLRNPLGTIVMAADALLEDPVTEQERVTYLNGIKAAGRRMNRLIQDLLDVARMEAGRLTIEPTRVEVTTLLGEVEEMMRSLARERSIGLDVIAADHVPAVWADSERIVQVFSNLVGNAIKFTPPGGHITLRADRTGDRVRMSVVDTGPGIPADRLSKIFGRFWQERGADRRGIGLGLSIAKGIVEAHGERIGVESRVGEGTVFWFTLPVATDDQAKA